MPSLRGLTQGGMNACQKSKGSARALGVVNVDWQRWRRLARYLALSVFCWLSKKGVRHLVHPSLSPCSFLPSGIHRGRQKSIDAGDDVGTVFFFSKKHIRVKRPFFSFYFCEFRFLLFLGKKIILLRFSKEVQPPHCIASFRSFQSLLFSGFYNG